MDRLTQEMRRRMTCRRRNTLLVLPKHRYLYTILLLHPGDRLKLSRWDFIWKMKRGGCCSLFQGGAEFPWLEVKENRFVERIVWGSTYMGI